MVRFITGFTAASLFLVCSALTAQEETPRTQNRNNQNRNTESQKGEEKNTENQDTQNRNDKSSNQQNAEMRTYYLGKLLLMNESEIQLAKLAQKRASAPEVKEFARMLEQDHSKLTQKIRAAAPEFDQLIEQKRFQTTSLETSPSEQAPAEKQPANPNEAAPLARKQNPTEKSQNPAENQTEPGELQTTRKATFPENPEWEGKPVYHILKHDCDATHNYLQAATKQLESLQGQDFDMAYLSMQIGAHTWAQAELKAFGSVQDPQVQELVRAARTGVDKHLQKAKELAMKHEGREQDDTSRPKKGTERENPAQTDPENRTPTQPQRTPTLPRSQPKAE